MHSGENNGRSKLKKEDVIEIRRLYNEEKKTRKEISEIYNQISRATINDIIGYRTWKNI